MSSVQWKCCVNSGHTKTESLISSRQLHKKLQGITQRFFDIALRAAQNDIKNLTPLEEKKRTIENGANRQAVSSYVNHSVSFSSVIPTEVEESFSFFLQLYERQAICNESKRLGRLHIGLTDKYHLYLGLLILDFIKHNGIYRYDQG